MILVIVGKTNSLYLRNQFGATLSSNISTTLSVSVELVEGMLASVLVFVSGTDEIDFIVELLASALVGAIFSILQRSRRYTSHIFNYWSHLVTYRFCNS